MCRRYPGVRPSDFMGFDNDYDAFQFDIGVAWKSHLLDLEKDQNYLAAVLNGFRNVVLSNGAKMPKVDKIKPLVKPKNYDETPNVRDIIAALSGKGSVVR